MSPTCRSKYTLLICEHEFVYWLYIVNNKYFWLYELFSPIFGPVQSTDRQKAVHISPSCNLHRKAQIL